MEKPNPASIDASSATPAASSGNLSSEKSLKSDGRARIAATIASAIMILSTGDPFALRGKVCPILTASLWRKGRNSFMRCYSCQTFGAKTFAPCVF
ncbi:hypothetical protein J2X76_005744 [Neorhizobium sp. 2083]|uniref:hypothetical protein n=1 Tax=Neorhizobium sp. 2083 TaxID=2817762 RepID=UPI00285A58DB|nr:hypothetical protein [Neorhizobium sp. 2083]MDR6820545.1 hypothetical protein [Neorhizobium sp. 2083]